MVNTVEAAVTLLAILAVGRVSTARILGVFPYQGYSHHMAFLPYLRRLADCGHDVHVISNFPSSHTRITDVNIRGTTAAFHEHMTFSEVSSRSWVIELLEHMQLSLDLMTSSTEDMFCAPAVRRLLSDVNATFDLVVAEHFNSEVPLGFAAKYRAPFVLLSSCLLLPWTMSLVGQPFHAAYKPSVLTGFSKRMSLSQRLVNALTNHVSVVLFRALHRPWSRDAIKRHLEVDVPLEEFASNVSLVLANTHWTVHGPSPVVPAVLEVGGMHIESAKRLPKVSKIFYVIL